MSLRAVGGIAKDTVLLLLFLPVWAAAFLTYLVYWFLQFGWELGIQATENL